MTNDQIKDRIRKVLALAQQGVGGEMEAAKQQLAAMLKALFPAFVNKHALFDIAERDDEQPGRQLSPDELLRILTIMRGMESPSYRKQLTE